MSADLLSKLTRALDIAVIERMASSGFALVAPAPAWLAGALGAEHTLFSAFPFLRHFLDQAEATWQADPRARADSGPFEATINAEAMLLRATALSVDTHKLLVVERLTGDADLRPLLQRAREQLLEHEGLTRRAADVHAPASAIARDVAALGAIDLPPAARALVESLAQSSAALQAAVAPLPVPPPGVRRIGARPR
jgi:hypothetical protein